MMKLRAEMRLGADGTAQAWIKLDDVLDWLRALPLHTNDQIPAQVVHEIEGWIGDSVTYDSRFSEAPAA